MSSPEHSRTKEYAGKGLEIGGIIGGIIALIRLSALGLVGSGAAIFVGRRLERQNK